MNSKNICLAGALCLPPLATPSRFFTRCVTLCLSSRFHLNLIWFCFCNDRCISVNLNWKWDRKSAEIKMLWILVNQLRDYHRALPQLLSRARAHIHRSGSDQTTKWSNRRCQDVDQSFHTIETACNCDFSSSPLKIEIRTFLLFLFCLSSGERARTFARSHTSTAFVH